MNQHRTLRMFLGHATDWDETAYEYQTVVDNVCLLRLELLAAIGQLVVESGHRVAKKKRGEPLRGRCDSFVVETDVHYPTDVSCCGMRCGACCARPAGRRERTVCEGGGSGGI